MTTDALVLCFVLMGLTLPAKADEPYSAIDKAPALSPRKTVDPLPLFNVAFDGSVPLELDSNIYRVPHNATADFHYSPYLKLSALTDLRPDLTYSLYADTSINRYMQYFNNNGSWAGVGTQLTKRWDALQLGAVYEWNQYYDREFRDRLGANNDVTVFLRYAYSAPDLGLRIRPSLSMTTRLDENLAVQRYLYYFKVDFERGLVDRWSVFLTPRLRYYDYTGVQAGRRDWIYSASMGLRRRINDSLEFTTTVGYESRVSNLPGRSYNDLRIEASLDFSYTLFRSEAGASSEFLKWLSH